MQLVEFIELNYKQEFEVVPELDGIAFSVNARTKDICDWGFHIDLNDKNHLTIKHDFSRGNCNKLILTIIRDFQHQQKFPRLRLMRRVCLGRI